MTQSNTNPTRKKVLLWGAAVISSLSLFNFFDRFKSEKKETVKMLTQDGKLVEIDKNLLAQSGKKISNKELQNWVKK
jgi:hypothetical protein